MYDFWAPTMVVPFVVALFWYHPSRVYAVVAALFVVLPLISRLPLSRLFQPSQQSALDSEKISWFP